MLQNSSAERIFNMDYQFDTDDEKAPDPKDLKLLELLIDKITKRLEEDSCELGIQDALKAIQLKPKVAKTSESERIFWEMIDGIRSKTPPPVQPDSLEAQILKTILGLKDQVRTGILPVKTITDTFNQGKSKESQLTYPRIGRFLSTLGFKKAKTGSGASAIIWDEEHIYSRCPALQYNQSDWMIQEIKKSSSEPSERSEPSETSEAKEALSVLGKDHSNASPDHVESPVKGGGEVSFPLLKGKGQVENPTKSRGEVNTPLTMHPPSFWSPRH
jgi:hypothetical protein